MITILFMLMFIGLIAIILFLALPFWIYFLIALLIYISKRNFIDYRIIFLVILGIYKLIKRDRGFKFYYKQDFSHDYNQKYEYYNPNTTNDSEYEKACSYFGITSDMSEEEKKRKYKEFAKKYHPDVNKSPDASEKMKEINKYWNIIKEHDTLRH